MKIAIATFAGLPNPPVKGGAVETLIDDLCKVNELKNQLSIDVYSVYDYDADKAAKDYKNTEFIFYQQYRNKKLSKKNIVYKILKRSIPDKTMLGIVELLNYRQYDYVIITSINYEMEYVFQKINARVIWYLHGDPLSSLKAESIKRITNHCRAVITVSDFINSRIRSVDPNCEVITVRNCTDMLAVSSQNEFKIKKMIREKNNVELNNKLFVYIGRITPIKGIYELVQAFVLANIPNTKLLIVGMPSNDDEKKYFEKIKTISNSNVKYAGYIPHNILNEFYCAADCIVAPSICQEAAPLIALEAAVCHRPIITTNIGGIPEYVDSNAIMVEYNDKFVENLVQAMKKVYNNKFNVELNERETNQVEKYYKDFVDVLQRLYKGEELICQD